MAEAATEPYAMDEGTAPVREQGQPRKRRRLVVSCTECHRRKQKCDRDLPCANCKARNKESACAYETGPPSIRKQKGATPPSPHRAVATISTTGPVAKDENETLLSMAAAWGYSQTGASTMALMEKIEKADVEGGESDSPTNGQVLGLRQDSAAVKEKYKGLIRQLPAKLYLEKLIEVFLAKFNHHYWFVDPDIFYRQLEEWQSLTFKNISTLGPQSLSPDLRVFPAVLFQIIGTALLTVSEGSDSIFEGLKYAGSMSFTDLACDYSESGMAVVNLFGKRGLSLTTVQAEFLRASFLKFSANVTESWHVFSTTVRDAQELGMHRDSLDPKPPANASPETALEYQWLVQRRRKMFMILAIWDINIAIILGRPGVIDWRYGQPTPPVDAPHPSSRTRTPVVPRDPETEPPTPLSKCLWGLRLTEGLRAVKDMEQFGPYPKDWSKVDAIHQKVLDVEEEKPAFLRLENPDTRWDHLPSMQWLREARYHYATLHQFGLMALHRPYIFHRKQSRVEGLKASLQMLELQRQGFEGLPNDSQANYHLFYGSFDAMVLVASVYILFPHEHPESRDVALQQFHWAIERFSAMQERNQLAKSALGVIKAITAKMARVMANTPASVTEVQTGSQSISSATPASTRGTTEATPMSGELKDMNGGESGSVGFGGGSLPGLGTELSFPSTTVTTDGMGMSSLDDLSNLAPVYPVGDLIFNDLNAIPDGANGMHTSLEMPSFDFNQGQQVSLDASDEGMDMPWQFGGGFGEDTVWEFLNHYQPPVGPA